MLEKSCNQSTLPHAIIAVNRMSRNDSGIWDITATTRQMMEDLKEAPLSQFGKHLEFWRERNKEIMSVECLLKSYYRDIAVVYIPGEDRPNQLLKQIKALHKKITDTCTSSQQEKDTQGTKRNASDLSLLLGKAFDHFTTNIDKPFNFVHAWLEINPVPEDFVLKQGILELVIAVQKACPERDCLEIWDKVVDLVASSILLAAVRVKVPCMSEFLEIMRPILLI